MDRGIEQVRLVCLNLLNTLFLCFKVIRDKFKLAWIFPHRSITQFLRLKMIRDMRQWEWVDAHCLVAYILRLQMVRHLHYPAWNSHIYLISLGRVRVKFYIQKKWLRVPLINLFIMSYTPFILVCIGCLRSFLSQRFNDVYNTYFFMHDCVRLVLRQRFLMTYTPFIFELCMTLMIVPG